MHFIAYFLQYKFQRFPFEISGVIYNMKWIWYNSDKMGHIKIYIDGNILHHNLETRLAFRKRIHWPYDFIFYKDAVGPVLNYASRHEKVGENEGKPQNITGTVKSNNTIVIRPWLENLIAPARQPSLKNYTKKQTRLLVSTLCIGNSYHLQVVQHTECDKKQLRRTVKY